jgi:flavin-dependent dehydrogenase
VQPGLYQWTRLRFGGGPSAAPAGEPAGKTRSTDVTWRFVPRCAGPGYFLVGDAAAVLDPASSHGVLRALMTGMRAGQLAAAGGGAAAYCGWLREWVKHDIDALSALYASLQPATTDSANGYDPKRLWGVSPPP